MYVSYSFSIEKVLVLLEASLSLLTACLVGCVLQIGHIQHENWTDPIWIGWFSTCLFDYPLVFNFLLYESGSLECIISKITFFFGSLQFL